MQNNPLKNLQIIFISMLSGAFMFALVAFFVIAPEKHFNTGFSDFFVAVPVVVSALSIVLNTLVYKLIIRKISPSDSSEKKVKTYTTAKIASWAIIDFAVLLSIVMFILDGNVLMQYLFLILLVYFITKVPGKVNFLKEAQISNEELLKF
jgi:hypothetical protein